MTVLKLKADGSVEEAASGSAAPAEAPAQPTMMVTPDTLTSGAGLPSSTESVVAVSDAVEIPPMLLSMVKPQILRFKANEIQSHYMSLS